MITTPEEAKTAEQRVIDARNTLTSIEFEQSRIRGLIGADEYALSQLKNAIVEKSSEDDVLSISISEKRAMLESLSVQETALLKDITLLAHEISEAEREKADLELDVDGIRREMSRFSDELTDREREVSKREKKAGEREELASEKLEAIKAFRATL